MNKKNNKTIKPEKLYAKYTVSQIDNNTYTIKARYFMCYGNILSDIDVMRTEVLQCPIDKLDKKIQILNNHIKETEKRFGAECRRIGAGYETAKFILEQKMRY